MTFRIGRAVMEDHVSILAEPINAGNHQQRVLGVTVHIPQLHGAEVVHGYHAGGNTAEDVLLHGRWARRGRSRGGIDLSETP